MLLGFRQCLAEGIWVQTIFSLFTIQFQYYISIHNYGIHIEGGSIETHFTIQFQGI